MLLRRHGRHHQRGFHENHDDRRDNPTQGDEGLVHPDPTVVRICGVEIRQGVRARHACE